MPRTLLAPRTTIVSLVNLNKSKRANEKSIRKSNDVIQFILVVLCRCTRIKSEAHKAQKSFHNELSEQNNN